MKSLLLLKGIVSTVNVQVNILETIENNKTKFQQFYALNAPLLLFNKYTSMIRKIKTNISLWLRNEKKLNYFLPSYKRFVVLSAELKDK